MANKYTLDMMAAEMELIANRMSTAQASDRDTILAQMDALALRSAQLTGEKADELKARLDYFGNQFEAASVNRYHELSNQLRDSVVDIMGSLEELKAGQNRWGGQIMDAIRNLGNRIGSYVSTPVIIIEAIVSLVVGIVVGYFVWGGAGRVMEQVYDENLTPIGAVPKYTAFEQWGLAACFGILAAIFLFVVAYGITKLVQRRRV